MQTIWEWGGGVGQHASEGEVYQLIVLVIFWSHHLPPNLEVTDYRKVCS